MSVEMGSQIEMDFRSIIGASLVNMMVWMQKGGKLRSQTSFPIHECTEAAPSPLWIGLRVSLSMIPLKESKG
jgi:hypothetical protein